MLEILSRPASGSFEPLGSSPVGCSPIGCSPVGLSPVHLERLRGSGSAELDTDIRNGAAFSAALATSLCRAAGPPSHLPLQLASVPHISQAASWDCGLACAAMCLRALGLSAPSLTSLHALHPNESWSRNSDLRDKYEDGHKVYVLMSSLWLLNDFSCSVWTVDLAHLLRQFGLCVEYFTLTLGINPGFHQSETFYEHIEDDELRIQQLFEDAEGQGIAISQRSVPDVEIQAFLEEASHLIIALVDKHVLEAGMYLWNEGLNSPSEAFTSPSYTGHYIVVCGYDRSSDHYIIRDPDPRVSGMGFTCISRQRFNSARTVFGTDEDLLLISKEIGSGV